MKTNRRFGGPPQRLPRARRPFPRVSACSALCWFVACGVGTVHAQADAPKQVASQPAAARAPAEPANAATQPGEVADADGLAAKGESSMAEVIEVAGSVERAAPGVSPLADAGWTPVNVGDRLSPGTQLRTGLRSHANLRFGETTVVSVRSATHASIDEFLRSATTENVRIGLGYGTVRGSSSEGELRSDVKVDSTVATLAKRGTEGWEMFVEPMSGRFRISLAESGLVDAIRKLNGGRTVSRTVAPGEYATRNNVANMWIAQAVFDRNVTFYQATSVTAADAGFTTFNDSGVGVVAPGGGSQLTSVSRRADADAILRQAELAQVASGTAMTAVIQPGLLVRPEGNFGTPDSFRVLLPQSKRESAARLGRAGWLPRSRGQR